MSTTHEVGGEEWRERGRRVGQVSRLPYAWLTPSFGDTRARVRECARWPRRGEARRGRTNNDNAPELVLVPGGSEVRLRRGEAGAPLGLLLGLSRLPEPVVHCLGSLLAHHRGGCHALAGYGAWRTLEATRDLNAKISVGRVGNGRGEGGGGGRACRKTYLILR